jgi:hypothetical protein
MTKESYLVNFATEEGFEQLELISANFNGEPYVIFDETGAPDSSGVVTLRAGAHTYRIEVATATGRVSVTRTGD